MIEPWQSRSQFKRLTAYQSHVSAQEMLGLLDEIAFVDKLFWHLPPGILLSSGATHAALVNRFGYPGLHVGIALVDSANVNQLTSALSSTPIYFLDDLENPQGNDVFKHSLSVRNIPVIDVLRDLYPVWCAALPAITKTATQPIETAAILCPARSGSTYLSALLRSTGQFGAVKEHMRHHTAALARGRHISLQHWWDEIAKAGARTNGVFLTKIINAFLAETLESGNKTDWNAWVEQARNWKLITLSRPDIAARTVSFF